MVRKGRLALAAVLLFLVQVTVVHRFSYGFLRPNLLYALAAFLALEADRRSALVAAFALALLMDLGSAGRLGASALVLVSASACVVVLRERLVRERVWTDLLLTFSYLLGCGSILAVGAWLGQPAARLGALVARAGGQAAFTTALSPFLFAAFAKARLVASRSRAVQAA